MSSSPGESPIDQNSTRDPLLLAIAGLACIIFVIFSYYHILQYCSFRGFSSNRNQRRQLHDTNPDGNDSSLQFPSQGLDSFIMQTIPNMQFKKKNGADEVNQTQSTDCAVCLGEYEDGEWVKTLPNCSHVFHVSCIDTWFQTHSSCPLCRSEVLNFELSISVSGSLRENIIREELIGDRLTFYQVLNSRILQSSNFG